MPNTRPYGFWLSPITSELIVGESISLSGVQLDGADIYWLEGRPREQGRNVLVQHGPAGAPLDVTPPEFNVRTRVHEYGGGAAVVCDGVSYFSHMADQRLYRHAPGTKPVPLTPAGSGHRYADGVIDVPRARWIGVRESHTNGAVDNAIVDIDLATGGTGRVLAGGNDFYASPRLSPSGRQLAWLTWRHPNMPWVGTELWVGDIASDGTVGTAKMVAGGPAESVLQPEWSPGGELYFISDRSGWWNLYRLEGDKCSRALPARSRFRASRRGGSGCPAMRSLAPIRSSAAIGRTVSAHLARLDLASLQLVPIDLPYTDYGYVRARPGRSGIPRGFPDRGRLDRSSRPCDRHDRGTAAFGERAAGTQALFLHTGARLVSHRGRQDRACLLLSAYQSRTRGTNRVPGRHWW